MTGRLPLVPRGGDPTVRFCACVDKSAGPEGCWTWLRGLDKDGYGKFTVSVGVQKQRHVRASRYAFELTHGYPPMKLATHSCDNPSCCNPAHIEDASQKKNREDCAARGRAAKGDSHGSRTHPERVARGNSHGSRTHPERLARGESHGSKLHPERMRRGSGVGGSILTERDIPVIRSRREAGEGLATIAKDFGISPSSISLIAMRKTWRHVP